MTIIFLLEERSMKEVLDIILPKILPADVCFKTIPHSGKSDLQESIPRKLKAWRQPDVKFVIVQDQDSGDCVKIKEFLKGLAEPSGRAPQRNLFSPERPFCYETVTFGNTLLPYWAANTFPSSSLTAVR